MIDVLEHERGTFDNEFTDLPRYIVRFWWDASADAVDSLPDVPVWGETEVLVRPTSDDVSEVYAWAVHESNTHEFGGPVRFFQLYAVVAVPDEDPCLLRLAGPDNPTISN